MYAVAVSPDGPVSQPGDLDAVGADASDIVPALGLTSIGIRLRATCLRARHLPISPIRAKFELEKISVSALRGRV